MSWTHVCQSLGLLLQTQWRTHVVGGLAQVTVGGEGHGDDSGSADAAVEGLADVREVGGGHCVVLRWSRMGR